MAFTHLDFDACSYKQQLAESVGTWAYVSDPVRYYHPRSSRMTFGIVSGNDVSIVGNNQMTDLESDLFGIDRKLSRCDALKYINPCPTGDMNTCRPRQIVMRGNPSNHGRVIDLTPMHLPEAQMFRFQPVQTDPFMGNRMPRC
jgi:hypothetical protein